MTADSNETFRALVANGPEIIRNRWELVVSRVASIAAEQFQIILDREAILNLKEAKIATLSDSALNSEQVVRELLALPQVIKSKAERDLKELLLAGDETAVASLPTDRGARINEARRLGVGDGKTAAPKTAESEAVILRRALSMSPASRISYMRANGLA